jgi:alkylation response protein AidB-like acyl-CoA dehydrogenase
VNCAAEAAARALDRGDASFEIAAAKIRANMAAQIGHATAHQVHGAIGFTQEYDLHRWTRRLLSWASECGSERYWAERLGGSVAARGADAFWADLTTRSD